MLDKFAISTDQVAMIIADAREDAIVGERERIIKLLEADMEHAFGEDGECVYTKHHREVCNCDIIALIKGENK